MSGIISLFKQAYDEWSKDKASQMGAALAYYSIFSLVPLLVFAIAGAGLLFGTDAVQGKVFQSIAGLVGTDGAAAIQKMIANAHQPQQAIGATVLSTLVLLFGASGVFIQLKYALNTIWDVQPAPGGGIIDNIRTTVMSYFLSMTMVVGLAFLLTISLLMDAAVSALSTYLGSVLPGGEIFWGLANNVLSLGMLTVVFAVMFKYLPDKHVAWRDVWSGAALTAVLFTLGKFLIGLYIGKSSFASTYGAAGALVAMLFWIYYSAQLVFFGAEFTKVQATSRQAPATEPGRGVTKDDLDARKQQLQEGLGRAMTRLKNQLHVLGDWSFQRLKKSFRKGLRSGETSRRHAR